jgi:hypothetical protein
MPARVVTAHAECRSISLARAEAPSFGRVVRCAGTAPNAESADNNDRLRVIDPVKNVDRIISTKSAAVRTEFYTFDTDDGPSDAVEVAISRIESRAAPVFVAIDAGEWPLREEDRAVLANFLAVQLARQPGIRAGMERGLEEVMKMTAKLIAGSPESLRRAAEYVYGESAGDDQLAELREALLEDFGVEMHRNVWAQAFADNAPFFVQPIMDMTWALVETSGTEFITTDQPVVHWRWPDDASSMPIGLFNAQYTSFPISRTRLLRCGFCFDDDWHLVPRGDDPHLVIGDEGVRVINDQTARSAYQSIFVHPDAPK